MHNISREVIRCAVKNKCNRGYKRCKTKDENIEIQSYTSGVSALDKEEVTKENYNKKRRGSRGLFVTNKKKKINADINGSLNIMIKANSSNQETAMDNGREQRPIKKRVA